MTRLNAIETARRLPYSELVRAIERAARELAAGAINAPERLALEIGGKASLLCMPAVGADIGITKVVTVHPQNASHGRPAIQGEVIVFNANTGERLMMLDGPTVTARRTAAVTLLAIEKLMPHPPCTALLIGTGAQAAAHADALLEYFGVRSFRIASREPRGAARFCEQLRATHSEVHAVPVSTATLEPSGVGSDLVIALTTSKTPVIPATLPDSTLAIGVGAFRPDMAELPPELLKGRRIVVDYLKGAEREAGDLLQARVNWADVTELAEQLDGSSSSVSSPVPCAFKSVGHASWDLAAARVAMRNE